MTLNEDAQSFRSCDRTMFTIPTLFVHVRGPGHEAKYWVLAPLLRLLFP